AAAAHYFGVHASELTLAQAAMLAGLVQNPATTDPINYEGAAITRRNVVLNRMAHPDVAMITEAEAAAAKAESFDQSKVTSFNSGCAFAAYPFVCQYIEQVFASEQMAMFGATPEARLNFLHRGGLTIHTTIDPKAMDAAITAVMERAAPSDPVIAVSATVEAGTGRILQMSQSRPVMGSNVEAGETFYNYAVENWMGGAGGFQAGSTFKTYTLATALSQGASLGHYYDAPKNMDFSKDAFQSCDGAVYTPWTVRNFGDSEYGQITLLNATIDSVNTYFAQLIRDVGVCQTVNMAKYTGLHAARVHPETGGSDLIDDYHYDSIPSFTLGSAEVAPLNMAESYATFAARGVHCDPIIIDALEDRDGNSRAVPDANCQQVIDPAVADGVSQILNQVIYGSGASEGRVAGSWPQAAKTGTTDDAYAYWIMGFTRNYATAVAVAADNGSTYWDAVRGGDKSITGLLLPSGRRIPYSSGSTAGPILRAVMTQALTEQPVIPFEHYNPIRGSFNNRLTPTPTEEPEPPTLTVSYITPSVTTTITTTSKPPPTTIMPTTTTTIPPTTTITIPPTTTSTSSAPATSATTEVP
ncbi:MAG: penicillin-binding protein, partial [Propionibacteriaceae bacterium]|nr:penicillin-binding protein [Propionibacteriaceae bacterium]